MLFAVDPSVSAFSVPEMETHTQLYQGTDPASLLSGAKVGDAFILEL